MQDNNYYMTETTVTPLLPHELTDINRYNFLCSLKSNSHYGNTSPFKDESVGSYIYETYDTMGSFDLFSCLSKCMTQQHMQHLLLKYELETYNPLPVEHLSLSQVKPLVSNILFKYTWKAGGFDIEDNEWICYDSDSHSRYNVQPYELLFINTIHFSECYSDETLNFLKNITRRLESLAVNIKPVLKYKDEYKAKLVVLKFHIRDLNLYKDMKHKTIKL